MGETDQAVLVNLEAFLASSVTDRHHLKSGNDLCCLPGMRSYRTTVSLVCIEHKTLWRRRCRRVCERLYNYSRVQYNTPCWF